MVEPKLDRWTLIKDAVVFQLKLGLDALRDLFLSPVSIFCVILDLFRGKARKESLFYRLMVFGHKTDCWINLFGTRSHEEEISEEIPDENVDQLFSKLEVIIKDQHDKGGMTASAKAAVDRYMDKISGISSDEQSEGS